MILLYALKVTGSFAAFAADELAPDPSDRRQTPLRGTNE